MFKNNSCTNRAAQKFIFSSFFFINRRDSTNNYSSQLIYRGLYSFQTGKGSSVVYTHKRKKREISRCLLKVWGFLFSFFKFLTFRSPNGGGGNDGGSTHSSSAQGGKRIIACSMPSAKRKQRKLLKLYVLIGTIFFPQLKMDTISQQILIKLRSRLIR